MVGLAIIAGLIVDLDVIQRKRKSSATDDRDP
jgi:hypothetical protein